jgi:hypothetical protein
LFLFLGKTLHLTAISLSFMAAGELCRYRYLQRILHHADRGIAMLLQISRPLKPWDMQNIYAII